jgi:phosphoribosylamine--glycine ligase
LVGGTVVTAGGRVLSVTGWASDLATARDLAYQQVAKIHFAGCQYRRDIAARLTLE